MSSLVTAAVPKGASILAADVAREVTDVIANAVGALMQAGHSAGHLAGRRLELGEEASGVAIPPRAAIEQVARQVEALLQGGAS